MRNISAGKHEPTSIERDHIPKPVGVRFSVDPRSECSTLTRRVIYDWRSADVGMGSANGLSESGLCVYRSRNQEG